MIWRWRGMLEGEIGRGLRAGVFHVREVLVHIEWDGRQLDEPQVEDAIVHLARVRVRARLRRRVGWG